MMSIVVRLFGRKTELAGTARTEVPVVKMLLLRAQYLLFRTAELMNEQSSNITGN